MYLIKLDAIDSTNTFLSKYSSKNKCQNFTVVQASSQTKGKGQLNTKWESQEGKNLTFSVLLNDLDLQAGFQFRLSMLISVVLQDVLTHKLKQKVTIKWPNDILADSQKIAGILIENTIQNLKISKSIIGIGLNVNQIFFPKHLNNATSMKVCSKKTFNLDVLLQEIVVKLQDSTYLLLSKNEDKLKTMYQSKLYKFKQPTMFIDNNNILFMGKIINISTEGKLVVELENNTQRNFDTKTIKHQEFL